MRFEITIDRDLLEHTPPDQACAPMLIYDRETGLQTRASGAFFERGCVVYGPARQNGARVWIEADRVVTV